MSMLQAEVYEAFRALDVPGDKALKAGVSLSAAVSKAEDDTARGLKRVGDDAVKGFSKRDADIDAIREDVNALKTDAAVFKWMGGVLLTMVAAISSQLLVP